MRVLGVDPGLTRCGVGVVEGVAGRPLTMIGVGVVRTPADADLGHRLVAVEQGIERWLDEHRPEYVAVERVFSQHNVRTVMGTAQASAVAILCASRRGIPVALHTPSEVKAAVTGSGRADKAQVGAMVTRLLRLAAPPKPADAADALALAICHIWRAPAQNRLQQAVARAAQPVPRTPPARQAATARQSLSPQQAPNPQQSPAAQQPPAAPHAPKGHPA
ncbi:crossover junction endodeoxyribonuclease RuvC [Streptomyces sp. NPDC016675]|uniref:crossover junction endodeoxyribonuclease RuvC n=1 Tax=Streptomyces sp. NPDC016675 TaxID=3364970 RepID=UPI0036FDED37